MKKVEVTYEAAPLNESKTIEVNTVINEMQESVYEKLKKCLEIGDTSHFYGDLFHWYYLLETILDCIEDMKGQVYMFGSIKSIKIVE